MRFAGHGTTNGALNGALRTFMAWPERLLSPLPDFIGDDEAALLEPLGVALHALGLGGVSAGMAVGVCGAGPIGLLLIQLLRRDIVSRSLCAAQGDRPAAFQAYAPGRSD